MTTTEMYRSTTMTDFTRRPIAAAATRRRTSITCQAKQHGTAGAYCNRGCRCPEGREAWRLYSKRRRQQRHTTEFVNSVGTSRRLQGLAAAGWPTTVIAGELDVHPTRVERLRRCTTGYVSPATAAAVRQLTAELCVELGPSRKSRNEAARRGWVPLGAWDDIDDPDAMPIYGGDGGDVVDDEAIRRVLAGGARFGDLREAEQLALFRDHLDGRNFKAVKMLLGMSGQTFQAWRDRATGERVAA